MSDNVTSITFINDVLGGIEAGCKLCGWTDKWRVSDGSAQQSATMHALSHKCTSCEGKNVIFDPIRGEDVPYDCPDCGGSGHAMDQLVHNTRGCDDCMGSGKIVGMNNDVQDCLTCGGSGLLER